MKNLTKSARLSSAPNCLTAALVAIGLLAPWAQARAEEPGKEYGMQAMEMYDAWQCAAIATMAEDPDEFDRLFNHGLDLGRDVLDALAEDGSRKSGLTEHAPIVFTKNLGGPSADFMLGVMWSEIVDEVYSRVTNNGSIVMRPEERIKERVSSNRAELAFVDSNCRYIGRELDLQ